MSEDKTRQRVLEAAGPVFARVGFEPARVREIAELAGTAPAAVNYYFRSKEQLYVETVRYAAEACNRRGELPVWSADVPAEQRLKDFIRSFLSRFLQADVPAWHGDLIMREIASPTAGACEQFVREFVRPTFAVLRDILRDLVPADVSAEKLHLLGSSIVGQCLHYHHARHVLILLFGEAEYRRYDIDRVTDHVFEFTLAALRGLYPPVKEDKR